MTECEQERFEAERGGRLDDELERILAGIPDSMRRPRGEGQSRSRADDHVATALLDAGAPRQDFDALALARMRVQPWPIAIRLEQQLDDGRAAVRFLRRHSNHEPRTTRGVLEDVAAGCHSAASVLRRP